MLFDFVVIGAGYGGVSVASLLAKSGFSVLLLESHTEIGGCASFFKRKDFVFDVGATTLSGVLPSQPLGILVDELAVQPKMRKLEPGMKIHFGKNILTRYADKEKWISESENFFESKNQRDFWNKIFEIDSDVWDFLQNNKNLPPKSILDLLKLAKFSNFPKVGLVQGLFLPMEFLLEKFGLEKDFLFRKFIDEQLLITTQNTSKDAPFVPSAMGLAYPSETYYPFGGMVEPLKLITEKFIEFGGEILFKEKVTNLVQSNEGFKITTKKGNSFQSKNVVSNIPIWNLAKITEGQIQNYFQKESEKFQEAWGAFTLNFAIESKGKISNSYHQIHIEKEIPFCNSGSIFVSFSQPDDFAKAPKGWQTVTISTHTDVKNWQNLSKEKYQEKKQTVTNFILEEFDKVFEEFRESEKMFILSGSPNTFEFFTNREKGFVGGIPHSVKKNLLTLPSGITPFRNLFLVGDTVFPGQGVPAVVLSALNVWQKVVN